MNDDTHRDAGPGVAAPDPDGYPDTWTRGIANADAEAIAQAGVQAGDEAREAVAVLGDEEQRYRDVEGELKELKRQFGIVLEFLRLMVTETGTRKYHWDKEIYPFYKKYIEEKRAAGVK